MSDINKAILVGRVGNINSGEFNRGDKLQKYMNITVATNHSIAIREPNTGNIIRYEDKTVWHKASAFGAMTDLINNWGIVKGSMVRFEGRMEKSENHVIKDGTTHIYHDTTIILENVLNLTQKEK
jgi:single-stranded DNA-binding protein